MPDSFIETFIKRNQVAAGYEEASASTGERIHAELNLLRAAPGEIWTGAKDRASHLVAHPDEALTMAGTATAFGGALSLLGRSCKFGPTVVKTAGWVFGMAGAGDLMLRCRRPIAGAWAHPNDVRYSQEFGRGLGAFGVDMVGMGLAGYGGHRLAAWRVNPLVAATTTGKNVDTLVDAINAGKPSKSAALRDPKFESNLLREVYDPNLPGPKTVSAEATAEAQRIAGGINKWQAQHGQPSVSLDWHSAESASGKLYYGNAQATVDAKLLIQTKGPARTNIIAHELTHADQDMAVLRRLADRLRIGAAASPDESRALAKAYSEIMETPPKESWMNSVLSIRKGQPLSAAQGVRADILMSELAASQKATGGLSDGMALQLELNLKSAELRVKPDVVFNELTNPAVRQRLFGMELEPHFAQNRGPFSPAEIQALKPRLEELIAQRMKVANVGTSSSYVNYRATLFEREAWQVGAEAGWSHFFRRPSSQLFLAGGATAAADTVWQLGFK